MTVVAALGSPQPCELGHARGRVEWGEASVSRNWTVVDVGKGNFTALLRVLKWPPPTKPSKLGLATAGNSSGRFQRVAKYSLHPKAYAISLL